MRGFNFVLSRSDPMFIFLSGSRPLERSQTDPGPAPWTSCDLEKNVNELTELTSVAGNARLLSKISRL